MHKHEALIRRYFDACNAADHDALMSCFTPDAVHYFPPGLPDIPWRGAEAIARKWIWCVENLGSQWTIEKVLVSRDSDEAVIEWTHWKRKQATAQRGDEWYVFDPGSGLITNILRSTVDRVATAVGRRTGSPTTPRPDGRSPAPA